MTRFFLDELFRDRDPYLFSLADVLLAMTVSTILAFVLAQVYRATHRGTSYSQNYLHTLFIMAITTSVVMMIIGSNIARAFSLVGALSIIRFRTAVKDPRDIGFLFAAMLAGMGCGTQFYMPTIVFTFFIGTLLIVLDIINYGFKGKPESIVRVSFKKGTDLVARIEESLGKTFKRPRLLNRLLDFEEDHETNVYAVGPASPPAIAEFEKTMADVEGVVRVAVYQRDQADFD
jgi:hypothetical protein